MKKFVFSFVCLAMTAMAANQLPVQQVRASETLPNQGKNNYNVKNLLDENWATIWAAPFKGEPISLEFDMNAYEVAAIYIENGYWRDIKSMVNNSRAKNVNIYINSKSNLALSIDLKDGKEIYEGTSPQEIGSVEKYIKSKTSPSSKKDKEGQFIALPKVYNDVKKVILEVNSIYKGQKWNDLCISAVEFYGQRTNPVKVKFSTGSIGPYTTVTIEGTTWMAEDLDNGAGFTRHSAKNACPAGWRLPTQAEWKKLVKTANGVENLVKEPLQFYSHLCSEGECEFTPTYAVNRLNFGMVIDPEGGFYDGECSETGSGLFGGGVSYWTSDYTSVVTNAFSESNKEKEIRYDYVAFIRYAMDPQDDYCSLQTDPEDPDIARGIRCVKK